MPHMVSASANHSWRITLRLSEEIGSKLARTRRVGITWATPHSVTNPPAAYANTVAIETILGSTLRSRIGPNGGRSLDARPGPVGDARVTRSGSRSDNGHEENGTD